MPRWLVIAVAATAVVAVASAVMLVIRARATVAGGAPVLRTPGFQQTDLPRTYPPIGERTPLTPDPNVWDGWPPITGFMLTDQDGQEQTETMLDGRLTIIDFIFTNCPFACPGMTAEMAAAADELKDTGVRFISFSVDPEHDTPERLRQFAEEHKADLARWTFLTGSFETVREIAARTLMFELRSDSARPIELADGTTMSNVVHPSKLFLVGPDRRLIAMYDYAIPEEMAALKARARAAARELESRNK